MNYDTPSSADDVKNALEANEGLNAGTRQQIEQILGVAGGGDSTINVGLFDGSSTSAPGRDVDLLIVTPPAPQNPGGVVEIDIPDDILGSASAYIFQTNYDIAVTFNTVERVIASGNGNDQITVNGDKNTTLDGGNGNDTLVTSGGNDSVTGGQGNDSISTGAGNDTIVSGVGNDTIDGGTGLDIVRIDGDSANYSFAVQNGQLVVVANDESASVTAKNVEIVSFGEYDNVVVSGDQDTATALRMYEGVLGRSADLTGAQAWIDGVQNGLSVQQVVQGFFDSAEYLSKGINTNELFVDMLYEQALYRVADAEGRAAWINGLQDGMAYVDVAIGIVGSAEANDVSISSFLITGQV